MNNNHVKEYLEMCRKLEEIRIRHNNDGSQEEDCFLEEMDELWSRLDNKEKKEIVNKVGELL